MPIEHSGAISTCQMNRHQADVVAIDFELVARKENEFFPLLRRKKEKLSGIWPAGRTDSEELSERFLKSTGLRRRSDLHRASLPLPNCVQNAGSCNCRPPITAGDSTFPMRTPCCGRTPHRSSDSSPRNLIFLSPSPLQRASLSQAFPSNVRIVRKDCSALAILGT